MEKEGNDYIYALIDIKHIVRNREKTTKQQNRKFILIICADVLIACGRTHAQ